MVESNEKDDPSEEHYNLPQVGKKIRSQVIIDSNDDRGENTPTQNIANTTKNN